MSILEFNTIMSEAYGKPKVFRESGIVNLFANQK